MADIPKVILSLEELFETKNELILAQILSMYQRLQHIQKLLFAFLISPLREQCRAVNYDKGALILATNNANWSTQLRFQCPDILEHLRKHPELAGLRTINIIINPFTPSTLLQTPRKTNRLFLSKKQAQQIDDLAVSISHPGLKSALERLAQHAGRKDNELNHIKDNPLKT